MLSRENCTAADDPLTRLEFALFCCGFSRDHPELTAAVHRRALAWCLMK